MLRRESFVGKDDPLADVVVNDKGAVGRRVDGVAWEDFSAKWFHAFEIVGVDHGDVTAAFDAGLAGEGRQVVDGTGVLLERAINCYMVRLLDETDPLLVEDLPFSAVFPELLQERRDRVGGQGETRVVTADEGSCWTTLSLRKIQDELNSLGFPVSHVVISELLEEMGYSKQVNQKMLQVSKPHPDRDAQFQFINEKCKAWLSKGLPVISIDCKKKENLGNFKNGGAEYRLKGKPRHVYDHDWLIKELGKVAPFGIYNLNNNVGYVNPGQSRDTTEFASESVAKWWHFIGEESFPGCKKLFIVCDGGGSNGSRVRLWKWALACFAEFYGLEIHVSHLPPGTSKWNKVEHRLFSYISKSWAGQPLVDIETVVNLISNTTTRTGLKVRCDIDNNVYLKGTKITDEELDQIALDPIPEFGTWNYIIRGFKHGED